MKRSTILVFTFLVMASATGLAQSGDSLDYRHSIQYNIAGVGFERWGLAYEYRMSKHHALFSQIGGSYWGLSKEMEYGFGLHFRYYLLPAQDAKFLWLFKGTTKHSFGGVNVRYMNLDGIHNDAECTYESYFIGVGFGQSWVWISGFTIGYWLGYGPPIGAEFKWKDTIPEDGDSWAKTYEVSSGLDFGLSLGYSFGR